ncbi:hypothetical protein HMPREF9141_0099 [Prevotella multiformis DSM 16608]|uniref:Uncharacterized protein n=1 Tax=Prevotella multiformis DSM 16608 TaxID=888743 RepID=F0F3D3_9BACT|nr:hypothetical protein HMPREF9141_0099 [Prevotella multiformis DSM 16608]
MSGVSTSAGSGETAVPVAVMRTAGGRSAYAVWRGVISLLPL